MKYSVTKEEKYTIFSPQEENLNSFVAPDLKSQFVILANEGARNLILDLSNVNYVDSSGLSAILTANRLWKSQGTFILTGIVSENVKKLLKISRVDTVLTIIPTVKESIEYVFMDEIQREIEGDED